jgi:hypothetical protein
LESILADLAGAAPVGGTPEEVAQNAKIMAAEFAKAQSVECIPQSAQIAAAREENGLPATPARHTPPMAADNFQEVLDPSPVALARPEKIFLTGLPGTNILPLLDKADVHLFNVRDVVATALKAVGQLNGIPPAAIVNEFRKFGDGEYLLNLSNLFTLGQIRRLLGASFGTPAYWVRSVLSDVGTSVACDGKQVIVVGIRTAAEFKQLVESGFTHYHVMCSPATRMPRVKPEELASQLSVKLDADVQQKISRQRTGPRMNVVWNDSVVPPVQRFFSAEIFRKEVVGIEPVVVESDLVSQTL